MLAVQRRERSFEIVVYDCDCQVGCALYDANAKLAERGFELFCALHVDRLDAHTAFAEILLRDIRRKTKIRPIGGSYVCRRTRLADQVAALDQPVDRLADLVGREFS